MYSRIKTNDYKQFIKMRQKPTENILELCSGTESFSNIARSRLQPLWAKDNLSKGAKYATST